jgi:Protein of unknown function (DUF1822)
MTFSFDTLTTLEFEILPGVQQESWEQSQNLSAANSQWNAYLNQVCLKTFLPWLQAEYEPQATICTSAALLPSIWNLVNGTALHLGDKRLVLIPDKSHDSSELRVPQEWVDIDHCLGDYYLAVQVNPDELCIRVWGYTTHEYLKTMGTYDRSDRTYCLDAEYLVQDLSVLWVVRQLYPEESTRVNVAPIPTLSATQAENLLQRLASPNIVLPRLELPFELWGALFADDNWRQSLYQLRQGETQGRRVVANLSRWLENIFEESWQSLESLMGGDANLGLSFRQNSQAEATIQRVKLLNLPEEEVLLVVGMEPESDGRVGIRVQVRTQDRDRFLPDSLNLKLLSGAEVVIQSVASRSQDNAIQLKRFRIPVGTEFSLQLEVGDLVITEDFVI